MALDPVIYSYEVHTLIHELETFVGSGKVKAAVGSWRASLKKSSNLVKQYYRQNVYRWWPAFDEFWKLDRRKSMEYPPLVIALAADAKKLFDLRPTMPRSILSKFANGFPTLNGPAFLFEIEIAWHFFKKGYHISWFEEQGGPIPEFVVRTPKFDLEVECKLLTVDAHRRISRLHFCQLATLVCEGLRKLSLMGTVNLELNNPLPANHVVHKQISDETIKNVKAGLREGVVKTDWGDANVSLMPNDNEPFDFAARENALIIQKNPRAHTVIEAQNLLGYAVNAIEFSCLCRQSDDLLLGLLDVLKEAADRQLSGARPGMLCAFIPGIIDFRGLEQNSGIANMTGMLFNDKGRDHIAAVAYSSGARPSSSSEELGAYPALIFKNGNCRFPEASQFRFLDEPIQQ